VSRASKHTPYSVPTHHNLHRERGTVVLPSFNLGYHDCRKGETRVMGSAALTLGLIFFFRIASAKKSPCGMVRAEI